MPRIDSFDLPSRVKDPERPTWSKSMKTLFRVMTNGKGELPAGANLHTKPHMDLYHLDDYGNLPDDAWEASNFMRTLLELHWKYHPITPTSEDDLDFYIQQHVQFEISLGGETPVGFILDAVEQLQVPDEDPELLITPYGHAWFGRRIEDVPVTSVRRELALTLESHIRRYLADHRLSHGNATKSVSRLRGNTCPDRPLWLFHQDEYVLENPDLWLSRPLTFPLVAVLSPINTGDTAKDDTFLFLLRDMTHAGIVGAPHSPNYEVVHLLQIPALFTPNPEMEVRDAMKLYLTAGSLKNRRIVLEFNKFTTYYAETFGLRQAPVKGGATRFMMGSERAHLYISASPHDNHDYLEIRAEFAGEPSRAFYGRVVAYIGAFMAHCRKTFDADLVIDLKRSELVDAIQIEEWGKWAYQEVQKRFPMLNSRTLKGTP